MSRRERPLDLHVAVDAAAMAAAAGARILAALGRSLSERGAARLAVSGGRTPIGVYRWLAADASGTVDWNRVELLFADERAVPPDHPDSNYGLVRATLIEAVGIATEQVRRMRGEEPDLEAAASEYEPHLEERLDVLVLGIGEDGHVASIFPGSRLTMERVRRVAAVLDAPKSPARRLTITPRPIREARLVVTLASGDAKAAAVAAALQGDTDIVRHPARMLREYAWFVDRAAAAQLTRAI